MIGRPTTTTNNNTTINTNNQHAWAAPATPDVEHHYVHSVYARLASHAPQAFFDSAHKRTWPNVARFVRQLPPGAVCVDTGCGPNKYTSETGFLVGVDNCAEVLTRSLRTGTNRDLVIADALALPFRKGIADAVLCVSVLHHFSQQSRRRKCLQEAERVMKRGASMLVYVWAMEQPNGTFPGQDLLVPWNLHEIPRPNRVPMIPFHKDSTKEQRIIANSIPIQVQETSFAQQMLGPVFKYLSSRVFRTQHEVVPPAIPRFLHHKTDLFVSNLSRWSPRLGRRLQSLRGRVLDVYADELAEQIVEDAVAETMSTFSRVVFYRFYHVFRRGELENFVQMETGLTVDSSAYDCANWMLLLRKE